MMMMMMMIVVIINVIVFSSVIKHKIYLYFHLTKLLKNIFVWHNNAQRDCFYLGVIFESYELMQSKDSLGPTIYFVYITETLTDCFYCYLCLNSRTVSRWWAGSLSLDMSGLLHLKGHFITGPQKIIKEILF